MSRVIVNSTIEGVSRYSIIQLVVSPLVPLFFLLLGVAVLFVGLVTPRLNFSASASILSTSLAFIALLALGWQLPANATLSAWGPTSLFNVGLIIEVDALAWLFGLGVVGVALVALLTGLTRPGGRRIFIRLSILLLTAASLVALFAGNLLTRIVAWAFLDLVYFLALVLLARGEGLEPQAVLNLSFNSVGTLLAVAAALLISRTSPSLLLRDAALTTQSTLVITLAAVFRLGLFPLHLGLPTETNVRQGLGTVMRLFPAAVALEMLGRLGIFGFAEPMRPWLTLFAVGAVVVGAVQLWNSTEPRQGLTYVVIAQSGLALLAGLVGGAVALTAQSLALLGGAALLFLSSGFDDQQRWAGLFPLLGGAAMLGLPLTIGFVGAGGLYGGLLATQNWLALVVVVLAQGLLAAGLGRVALWPTQPTEGTAMAQTAYWVGLGLPAIGLVLLGALSNWLAQALALPRIGLFGFTNVASVAPLIIVVAIFGLGLALWRFAEVLRTRAESAWDGVVAVLRLDWLYRAVWSLFRLISLLVLNLAGVLEGEGALLWTLAAAVLVWLLFRAL